MENEVHMKVVNGEYGYVLEDVPHLSDYIPYLTYPNPLQDNPAYSVVRQYFVHEDDTVIQKVVVHKDSQRGIHFRRAGPRQKVYFISGEVHACIVTCGGLCPGLNNVIKEIVCGLYHMYGVSKVIGINPQPGKGAKKETILDMIEHLWVYGAEKIIDNMNFASRAKILGYWLAASIVFVCLFV